MELGARDRSRLEVVLTTARERLQALDGLSTPDDVAVLRAAIVDALGALDDALSLMPSPRDDGRVACPTCGSRVMRDATLCLSCWRTLAPTRAS